MQSKLIISLLLAAAGVNAAPAVEVAERATSIEVDIFSGSTCGGSPTPAGTTQIPIDGACGTIPSFGLTTDSAFIPTLPTGCQITLYSDAHCSSTNSITVTAATIGSHCFQFGTGRIVGSARTAGGC